MINIIAPLVMFCAVAGVFYLRSRMTSSRPSDREAIDGLMKSRKWRAIEVKRDENYWRYWLRGKGISNCTRIYIVLGERPNGDLCETHVGFDSWPPNDGQLQVLMEREVSRGTRKPAPIDDLL